MKFVIYLVIVSLFAITGCGSDKKTNDQNSSASSKSITYKEYSINDFSYELPSDWKVVDESNGGIKVTNLGDSAFSILVTSKVPAGQFEYFGEKENYLKNTTQFFLEVEQLTK